MKFLFRWFSVAIGFFAAAYLVPGVEVSGFGTAILLAALWGIIGILVRPILVVLTLPVTILTFGLFTFIINAGLFWWLGGIIEGFSVRGFAAALLGSLIMSAVSSATFWFLERLRDDED